MTWVLILVFVSNGVGGVKASSTADFMKYEHCQAAGNAVADQMLHAGLDTSVVYFCAQNGNEASK